MDLERDENEVRFRGLRCEVCAGWGEVVVGGEDLLGKLLE